MSQSQPSTEGKICCWYCNAPNDPGASECWLCRRRGWRHLAGLSPPCESPTRKRARLVRTIARRMIVIAVIAVLLGPAALVPAVWVPMVLFFLVISAVPAWIVTECKNSRRHERGEEVYSPGRQLAVFIVFLFV